ncbi:MULTISPECIES: NAD-dependent epimerase/dehydratase family protein [Enterococcus]|uniref:NAD-dependent epimerase/dehydratase domain-containing protein n=1 Tax=Enterococcus faecium TaxID=1352 RepID=A0AB73N392_ENTFC|nr:NAD-dependent epimerase/dehydratase family protein [Enterococcus faecium]MCZ1502755.1 NAD-dependent epimerase/dehydratase family protein [Enterococcus faecium]MDK4353593.1 NAD-dependent epimerase/dehydratase family protein [Enterococcus faecium]MDQ8317278.1 NAD-dependent epimerase/dehydratase family protein [Enterococcus faecium]MDT2376499.1 NAD-dependent epimerase/dehydratase family protein [Enterococcus faecium]MDV7691011.1 NAD-dependent epimerase/dehydratase family protein [Enterococcus 
MKKILITGANSYIGTSFKKWMAQFQDEYQIDTLSVRGDVWREHDFSEYDTVFHVAGIAHADVSKVSEETKQLYYAVNRDLAIETAKRYKQDLSGKNGQFIYMSSIIIYGEETNINKKRVITPDTKPNPSNFYGDSKLQAEIGLQPLDDDTFHVAILRPPMIYGPGSKGNYQQLVKLANKLPIFPDVKNERSMLHIDKLSEFVKERIDAQDSGVFFPQNDQYVRTSHMVRDIAQANGKKIYLFSYMNWAIRLLGYVPGKIGRLTNKAFGNLVYEKSKSR